MNPIHRLLLIVLIWSGFVPIAAAQTAPFRYNLLALLPDDFAVCLVMHDLRGHAARWEDSDWLKSFRQSAIGKALMQSTEMQQFERVQADMKRHLDLDWPTLRDDILGDTLILAYSPGQKDRPDDERGLFLLHVRKTDRLLQVIDRLNEAQIKADKLKLTTHEYKGTTYQRRVEGGKTQYYCIKDSVAAIASKEDILHAYLDRRAEPAKVNGWKARFERAGAESAFLTLCVNPRMLDAEILQNNKKDDPLPGYWKGLEAIFVTVAVRDDAELRISIQANVEKLPDWAKGAFVQSMTPSTLWQHFPEASIVTLASRTDFTGLADAMNVLVPEKDRKKAAVDWQVFNALLQRDLAKDVLPNIGPDWGLCILPSKDAKTLPSALFALAIKPAAKGQSLDRTFDKALEILIGLHNNANPKSVIRLDTAKQGAVDVKYLVNDKLFPAGLQPAYALKDGFLVFATTPEAILEFRRRERKADARPDTPLLRVSAPELARLLEHRREHILDGLTAGNMPPSAAKKNLEDVISLLRLFDDLTMSQYGEGGQASWFIRLKPAPR